MDKSRQLKFFYNFKNQRGQFAIEAVLLMLVLMGSFVLVTQKLKEKQLIQKLTNSSVAKVKSMTAYGTWKETCKSIKGGSSQTASNCHPNSINRALSSDPL